jgi:hypothetical protein
MTARSRTTANEKTEISKATIAIVFDRCIADQTGRGQTILSFYFVGTPVLEKFEVCWEFFAVNSMLKGFDPAAHKARSQRRWSILTALAGVVDDPIVSW